MRKLALGLAGALLSTSVLAQAAPGSGSGGSSPGGGGAGEAERPAGA
jgi:hypothetical protein